MRCAFEPCGERAQYRIEFEPDFGPPGPFAACERHTAEARATDPLGYIVCIRSLNRPLVVLP